MDHWNIDAIDFAVMVYLTHVTVDGKRPLAAFLAIGTSESRFLAAIVLDVLHHAVFRRKSFWAQGTCKILRKSRKVTFGGRHSSVLIIALFCLGPPGISVYNYRSFGMSSSVSGEITRTRRCTWPRTQEPRCFRLIFGRSWLLLQVNAEAIPVWKKQMERELAKLDA